MNAAVAIETACTIAERTRRVQFLGREIGCSDDAPGIAPPDPAKPYMAILKGAP